jgi:Putative peptidoglycan binding domain
VFFILICSFALVCAARGEEEQKKAKTQAKILPAKGTPSKHPTGNPTPVKHPHPPQPPPAGGHPPKGGPGIKPGEPETQPETPPGGSAAPKPAASAPAAPVYHYSFPTKSGLIGRDFTKRLTPEEHSAISREIEKGQAEGTQAAHGGYEYDNGRYHYSFPTKSGVIGRDFTRPLTSEEHSAISREIEKGQPQGTQVRPGVASTQAKVNPLRSQHFNLPSKPDPAIAGVKFGGNNHIPGSETWTDPKYAAFRDYHHEWHDKNWWTHHPNAPFPGRPEHFPPGRPPIKPPVPIVLVYGGWYWWHEGYWYPAWGYDSHNTYYVFDGPIYAYNGLAPDQVVANVQAALQAQGYYHGPINGLLDPATREALADYQRDQGLYTTSAIDEPTLAALEM